MKAALLEMQRHRCAYCLIELTTETATFDHLEPVSRGGRNTKVNLVAACRNCNKKRGVMDPIRFWFKRLKSLTVPMEMVR